MEYKDEETLKFGGEDANCDWNIEHRLSVIERLIPEITVCLFDFKIPHLDYKYVNMAVYLAKQSKKYSLTYFRAYSISEFDIVLYLEDDIVFNLKHDKYNGVDSYGLMRRSLHDITGTIIFKYLLPTQNQLETIITDVFYKTDPIFDINNSDIIPIIVLYCTFTNPPITNPRTNAFLFVNY